MRANVSAKVRTARLGLLLLAAFCITMLTASPAKANTTITGPCPVVIAPEHAHDSRCARKKKQPPTQPRATPCR